MKIQRLASFVLVAVVLGQKYNPEDRGLTNSTASGQWLGSLHRNKRSVLNLGGQVSPSLVWSDHDAFCPTVTATVKYNRAVNERGTWTLVHFANMRPPVFQFVAVSECLCPGQRRESGCRCVQQYKHHYLLVYKRNQTYPLGALPWEFQPFRVKSHCACVRRGHPM